MKKKLIIIGIIAVGVVVLFGGVAGVLGGETDITRGDTSTAGVGSGSSSTFAHDVSGSDTLLVVGVNLEGVGRAVNSVTYNGDALTFINADAGTGANYNRAEMWYMLAPDDGTHNVIVTFNGNLSGGLVYAVTYSNVKQQAPTTNGATHVDAGTVVYLSLTSTVDNSLFVGTASNGSAANSWTMTAGPTEIYNNSDSSLLDGAFAETILAVAGSSEMRWTAGGASRLPLVMAVFAPLDAGETPLRISIKGGSLIIKGHRLEIK